MHLFHHHHEDQDAGQEPAGDAVDVGVALHGGADFPGGHLAGLLVAEDGGCHAVGDEVPGPVLHLHGEPVGFPPAGDDVGCGDGTPVGGAGAGVLGRERDLRHDR